MIKKTPVRVKFGKRLRDVRREVGMSQEELGFKSGLHRTYVGSIERGEQSISVDNVYKLAKALTVEPKKLFEN
jgi:transcriptional regulator with XRE-family HTH domain